MASEPRPLLPDATHCKPLAKPASGHTRLILVRHGETDWNKAKRYQGHTDIPLNARGLAQAQALAKRFASEPWLTPHAAYSSDLQRAWVTAQTLLGAHSHKLQAEPNLRERNYGIMAGLTADEMQAKSATVFDGIQKRIPDAEVPEGESLTMLYNRIVSCTLRLVSQHPGESVLLVAHGGVLDCLYRYSTGQPLHTPRSWPLPNAALNVVDICPKGNATVALWADLSHESNALLPQSLDEVDTRVA